MNDEKDRKIKELELEWALSLIDSRVEWFVIGAVVGAGFVLIFS